MKLSAQRVDAFIERPDPQVAVALLHGPDAGLIEERAARLARKIVDDVADPFRVSELTGEQLETAPHRLIEEAQALCLLGGRRLVRVRLATEKTAAKAVAQLLELETPAAYTVIEADELSASSKLRTLVEKAPHAAALPCYRDEARDLDGVIRTTLAAEGLTADADAMRWLVAHLGSDRGVTRRELEKLALYVSDRADRRVRVTDCEAVIGDSAAFALDDLILATLLDERSVDRLAERLLGEGHHPVRLIRAASSMVLRLLRFRSELDRGSSAGSIINAARPPIFFKLRARIEDALHRWTTPELSRAQARLLNAELAIKTARSPDLLICRRTLAELHERGAALTRRA